MNSWISYVAPGVRSRSVDLKIFDTMMKSLEQEEWKKGSDYPNHACNDYDDLVWQIMSKGPELQSNECSR